MFWARATFRPELFRNIPFTAPASTAELELVFVRKMTVQKGKAVKEGQKEESSEDGQSEEYKGG